ncbi:MAG: NAD-binding protein [Chloroflexi bacterium]|nr:NAD-binding protein [Chloroflexota bacterium]
MADNLLPGRFDPHDFALRLARKDVDIAVALGREFDVPMRLASLAAQELTAAVNRGWGNRDSQVAMVLQEERACVQVRVPKDALSQILEQERGGANG